MDYISSDQIYPHNRWITSTVLVWYRDAIVRGWCTGLVYSDLSTPLRGKSPNPSLLSPLDNKLFDNEQLGTNS